MDDRCPGPQGGPTRRSRRGRADAGDDGLVTTGPPSRRGHDDDAMVVTTMGRWWPAQSSEHQAVRGSRGGDVPTCSSRSYEHDYYTLHILDARRVQTSSGDEVFSHGVEAMQGQFELEGVSHQRHRKHGGVCRGRTTSSTNIRDGAQRAPQSAAHGSRSHARGSERRARGPHPRTTSLPRGRRQQTSIQGPTGAREEGTWRTHLLKSGAA